MDTILDVGHYYWMKHISDILPERWQPAYIGIDPDDNVWIHRIDIDPVMVKDLDLSKYEFIELEYPDL